MTAVVIDTNVLLVAAGRHEDISDDCVETCTIRLQEIKISGTVVVIDDAYRVLREYQNKLDVNSGRKDMGTVFLKWLQQNKANPKRVAQVTITEVTSGSNTFVEFPVASLEPEFDPSDRMFPAIANTHESKPPILEAADCKWLRWWEPLSKAGIQVDFVCPKDVCRFYRKKFPGQPLPALP